MLRVAFLATLAAALAAPTPTAAPDDVAVVGPVRGAWTVDGKPAALGEPIPAGAALAHAESAAGSIAIYMFDGRLVRETCPGDHVCAGPFALDPLGDTTGITSVVRDATKALPHYHFIPSIAATGAADAATPTDAIAPLGPGGTVDFGDVMHGVPPGPYRLVLRPLDPHTSFAASGDAVFKLFSWTGDPISVVTGGVPAGLYSARLFARDSPDRALGAPAWAAVIPAKNETAIAGFRTARDIASKWNDAQAQQLFLRSYLVEAAFPQPTPGPSAGSHRHER